MTKHNRRLDPIGAEHYDCCQAMLRLGYSAADVDAEYDLVLGDVLDMATECTATDSAVNQAIKTWLTTSGGHWPAE